MNALCRGALTFLGLQAMMMAVAYACSCGLDDYDPLEIMAGSDQVFVGTVVSGPRVGIFSGCDRVSYRLEVTEAFKGVEVGDTVTLSTARDGASCGIEFGEGESWLIYSIDGRYGLCEPGGPARGAEDELEILRAGE